MHIQTNGQGKFKNTLHTVNARVGLKIWVKSYMVTKQQKPHIHYNIGIKGNTCIWLGICFGMKEEAFYFLKPHLWWCRWGQIAVSKTHRPNYIRQFSSYDSNWLEFLHYFLNGGNGVSVVLHSHPILWSSVTFCCKSQLCSFDLPIVMNDWVILAQVSYHIFTPRKQEVMIKKWTVSSHPGVLKCEISIRIYLKTFCFTNS